MSPLASCCQLLHDFEIIGLREDTNIQEAIINSGFWSRDEAATITPNVADYENQEFCFQNLAIHGQFGLMWCLFVPANLLR